MLCWILPCHTLTGMQDELGDDYKLFLLVDQTDQPLVRCSCMLMLWKLSLFEGLLSLTLSFVQPTALTTSDWMILSSSIFHQVQLGPVKVHGTDSSFVWNVTNRRRKRVTPP